MDNKERITLSEISIFHGISFFSLGPNQVFGSLGIITGDITGVATGVSITTIGGVTIGEVGVTTTGVSIGATIGALSLFVMVQVLLSPLLMVIAPVALQSHPHTLAVYHVLLISLTI